jgi:hypothetical protein
MNTRWQHWYRNVRPWKFAIATAVSITAMPLVAYHFVIAPRHQDIRTSTDDEARERPSPTIAGSSTLPAGTNWMYYSPVRITVSGGTAPYTCSIAGGALPPGVTESDECVFSGIPTRTGTHEFTIRVTDALGATVAQAYQLKVRPLSSIPFDATNPILYINDNSEDSYHDEYMEALSAAGTINLVGMVRNSTIWPYNIACGKTCTAAAFDRLYALGQAAQTAARNSWYKNGVSCAVTTCFPPLLSGSPWGNLTRPASGNIDDTTPLNEAGARLIVAQAKLATFAKPLVVVVGGPLTPIADAYLLDHSIVNKVIIAYEGGAPLTGTTFSFDEYNGDSDAWAAYICAARFRMVVTWPLVVGYPSTPQLRMIRDLPGSPIKRLMTSRDFTRYNQPPTGTNMDSTVGITIMNPKGWVTSIITASMDRTTTDPHSGHDSLPHFAPDVDGRILYIKAASTFVATTEWWRAMLNPSIWGR